MRHPEGRPVGHAEPTWSAHLKGQVADYKLPEELHIVEELPFTATGKLRRHVLAERIAKAHGVNQNVTARCILRSCTAGP